MLKNRMKICGYPQLWLFFQQMHLNNALFTSGNRQDSSKAGRKPQVGDMTQRGPAGAPASAILGPASMLKHQAASTTRLRPLFFAV